jgi:hypothetical protein
MTDTKRLIRFVGLGALLSIVAVAVCLAWVFPGRMTGGGSVFKSDGTEVDSASLDNLDRVTHGFELHCGTETAPPPGPNNLEINWKDEAGNSHKFHLNNLAFAECTTDGLSPNPPPAPFDLMEGGGTGSVDNVKGFNIYFQLTDHGEPGTSDTAMFAITDANGNGVLYVPTTNLTFGDQQAHAN